MSFLGCATYLVVKEDARTDKVVFPELDPDGVVINLSASYEFSIQAQELHNGNGDGFGFRPPDSHPEQGALVAQVVPDGSADKAGMKVGDLIQRVDGKAIAKSRDLSDAVGSADVSKTLDVMVLREGNIVTLHPQIPKQATTLGEHERASHQEDAGAATLGLKVLELPEPKGRFDGIAPNRVEELNTSRMPFSSGKLTLKLQPDQTVQEVGIDSSTGIARAVSAAQSGLDTAHNVSNPSSGNSSK
jgi:membrane-associated protease RseP (regulator of RpoE activity)